MFCKHEWNCSYGVCICKKCSKIGKTVFDEDKKVNMKDFKKHIAKVFIVLAVIMILIELIMVGL